MKTNITHINEIFYNILIENGLLEVNERAVEIAQNITNCVLIKHKAPSIRIYCQENKSKKPNGNECFIYNGTPTSAIEQTARNFSRTGSFIIGFSGIGEEYEEVRALYKGVKDRLEEDYIKTEETEQTDEKTGIKTYVLSFRRKKCE